MIMEEERLRRLSEWSRGNPQGPISIHIDPTNRCNVRCRFCWQRSQERQGIIDYGNELSDERLVQLADEAYELGVRDWLISGGGEPLVRTNATLELMKRIKKHGMDGDIITNGAFFNRENLRELVLAGWDRIRMSLHSADEETHDFLMQSPGSYKKIVESMRIIAELKKELGTDKPELGFNTVINSKNYNSFSEIIELLVSLGGDILNVQTIILYDTPEQEYSLTDEQKKDFQKHLRHAVELARKHNVKTNLANYLDQEVVKKSTELGAMDDMMKAKQDRLSGFEGMHCFEPWYLMTIRSNGIVGSCRLFGDEGDNLHKKSLKEIWYGKYYERNRQVLSSHSVLGFCKHCGSNEFMENRKIGIALSEMKKGKTAQTAAATSTVIPGGGRQGIFNRVKEGMKSWMKIK